MQAPQPALPQQRAQPPQQGQLPSGSPKEMWDDLFPSEAKDKRPPVPPPLPLLDGTLPRQPPKPSAQQHPQQARRVPGSAAEALPVLQRFGGEDARAGTGRLHTTSMMAQYNPPLGGTPRLAAVSAPSSVADSQSPVSSPPGGVPFFHPAMSMPLMRAGGQQRVHVPSSAPAVAATTKGGLTIFGSHVGDGTDGVGDEFGPPLPNSPPEMMDLPPMLALAVANEQEPSGTAVEQPDSPTAMPLTGADFPALSRPLAGGRPASSRRGSQLSHGNFSPAAGSAAGGSVAGGSVTASSSQAQLAPGSPAANGYGGDGGSETDAPQGAGERPSLQHISYKAAFQSSHAQRAYLRSASVGAGGEGWRHAPGSNGVAHPPPPSSVGSAAADTPFSTALAPIAFGSGPLSRQQSSASEHQSERISGDRFGLTKRHSSFAPPRAGEWASGDRASSDLPASGRPQGDRSSSQARSMDAGSRQLPSLRPPAGGRAGATQSAGASPRGRMLPPYPLAAALPAAVGAMSASYGGSQDAPYGPGSAAAPPAPAASAAGDIGSLEAPSATWLPAAAEPATFELTTDDFPSLGQQQQQAGRRRRASRPAAAAPTQQTTRTRSAESP